MFQETQKNMIGSVAVWKMARSKICVLVSEEVPNTVRSASKSHLTELKI